MMFKILTWNIKRESSFGWNNQHSINSRLVDKFIAQEADIFVLTSFVLSKGIDYLFEHLENERYIWFTTTLSGKNGILIAKKDNLTYNSELVKNCIIAMQFHCQ